MEHLFKKFLKFSEISLYKSHIIINYIIIMGFIKKINVLISFIILIF